MQTGLRQQPERVRVDWPERRSPHIAGVRDDDHDSPENVEDEVDTAEGDAEEETAAGEDDVPLEDAVVERMQTLSDGTGVSRSELVAAVADERGADAEAVEDAVQDALMSGRCYESGDDELTPI